MKKIKIVPGTCKECYFADVKECLVQCKLPSHCCCIGDTCYKKIPVTNGDMVRKMSNKEFAEWLKDRTAYLEEGNVVFEREWLNWLEQEAKGEE